MKILEQTSTHLTFKDTTLETGIFKLGGAIFLLIGILGSVLLIFLNIIFNRIDSGIIFMTLVMTTPIITGAFLLLYFPEKIISFNKNLDKLTIKSEALLRKEKHEYAISDIRQVTLALEGVERHKIDLFNKNLNDLISQKEHEYPMKDTQKRTFDTDKLLKNQSYSILLTFDSKNQSIRLFSLKSPDAEKVVSLICEFINIT